MRKTSHIVLALLSVLIAPGAVAAAQAVEVVGYSARVSRGRATLELQYADGAEQQITFQNGQVLLGDAAIGQYTAGVALETAWRALLGRNDLTSAQMLAAVRALPVAGLPAPDLATLTALHASAAVPPAPAGIEVPPMPDAVLAEVADAGVAAADVQNHIRTTIRNNIREGIRDGIQIEIPEIAVAPGAAAVPISTVPGGLLALFGTLLALSGLALGTSFFAERQLDVMADTVQKSLARSFFVGLFAQPLIIPALGALVVGLVLTVVGILVVPFAIAGFLALLAVGLVGGYLAVARATGATFLARRGQDAASGGMTMVKSIVVGLALLLALWLPAVLLGWVPVMGTILQVAAALMTWGLVTTGFGAAILTRGGVRGTFGQRFAPAPVPFSHQLSIPDEEPAAERFSTAEWLSGKGK